VIQADQLCSVQAKERKRQYPCRDFALSGKTELQTERTSEIASVYAPLAD
jgi:hypothetical protein